MALLDAHTLLAVDTETTGMSPGAGARLVEVARVTIAAGVPGEGWSSLVRPGAPIPADATRVHGIDDAMVAGAPGYADVGAALRAACADLPLAFHNAPFDLPFLRELFREAGTPPLVNPIVDTLGLARGLSGQGGNSLGEVARRLGVPAPERAHRALADATMTAHVLVRLAARWEAEKGVRSLAELAAVSQDVMRLTARR